MRQVLGFALVVLLGVGVGIPGADAQVPSTLPLIVILDPGPSSGPSRGVDSFKRGLVEFGWVEGSSVRFETHYADYSPDRMAALAKEAASLRPDLIFTHGPLTRMVTQATATVSIVVGVSGDLVAIGVAKSLARPGGNITGMSVLAPELDLKRLEILKAAAPTIRRVGVLSALKKSGADALLVQDEPMLSLSAQNIAALALALKLPSISQSPRFAESGGLLQFGVDILETFRRSAGHADRILRGAKPGDLPIEQPSTFELVVNLRTANTLGLTLAPSVLMRANRVIK